MLKLIIIVVYLVIGLVVASNNDYLANLNDLSAIISALLAVVLWPLVILGIDLHIGDVQGVDIKKGLGPLTLPVFLTRDGVATRIEKRLR
jgi:hypothetical protein